MKNAPDSIELAVGIELENEPFIEHLESYPNPPEAEAEPEMHINRHKSKVRQSIVTPGGHKHKGESCACSASFTLLSKSQNRIDSGLSSWEF